MDLGAAAAGFSYGSVDLSVISFESHEPPRGLLRALTERVASGDVRILDLVLITRSATGAVRIREIEDDDDRIADLVLHARGLIAEEDLLELAPFVRAGGTAAVVALEPIWSRRFAEQLSSAGSVIVATVRVPPAAVNAAVEIAFEEGE